MKPPFPAKRRTFHFLAALAVVIIPSARATTYSWEGTHGSGANGDFSEAAGWYNGTSNKLNDGAPGGGDVAIISGNTLTCSGGSVLTLSAGSNGGLNLTGGFSVTNLGTVTLTGTGSVTAANVGNDAVQGVGDHASYITTTGVSVTINNMVTGYLSVNGGGSAVVKGSVTNVSGAANGSKSLLEIDGSVTNGGVGATGGAAAHVGSLLFDGTSSPQTPTIDGAGSTLTVDGDVTLHNKALNLSNGAQATVGGNMGFYANTLTGGAGFSADGAGTSVSVAGTFNLSPGPGGGANSYIGAVYLSNGALLRAKTVGVDGGHSPGSISMSNGANIQTANLSIGLDSRGSLDIESGSGVTLAGGGAAVFGFDSGSDAEVYVSGAGSFFNAAGTLVAIGKDAGSSGNVFLDSGGVLQVGAGSTTAYLHVGDAGTGNINNSGGTINIVGSGTTFEIGSATGSNGSVGIASPNGLTVAGPTLVGNQGTGRLSVSGAGNSATASGNFDVGGDGNNSSAAGHGNVYVSGGAQLTVGASTDSHIEVGVGAGGVGEIYVTGAGSSLVLNGLTIAGEYGEGELAASNGATAQSNGMQLGAAAGASGGLLVYNNGTVWNESLGIVVGSGTGKASGGIAVNDGGLLRIGHKLFIKNDGVVTVTQLLGNSTVFPNPPTPTTSTPNGRIIVGTDNFGPDGAIRVGMGGVLKGQGKQAGKLNINVVGKVVVGLGGKFQPGSDPDVFSVQGDVDLSDGGAGGGETDFEIGGAGVAGTDYDQLQATGTVTLGGTLNLTLLPGYTPKVGDTFNFVQAGTVTGSFVQVVAPGLTVSPTANGSGGLTVTVTAVTVAAPPVITSATAATAYVGSAFSYQIAATNSPAGYTATGLPDGLEVDAASGLISGTATAAGTYSVALSATNTGGTGTATLTLTVSAAPAAGAPIITSAGTATGQAGTAFSYQIVATNGPTSFGASGLPAGLSVDAGSGSISGTLTAAGTFSVNLSAANASGTGTATLTLTVAPGLPVVTLTAAVPSVTVGSGLNGQFLLTIPAAQSTDLHVAYTVKGTGINGTDYVFLKGTAKLKAGKTTKAIKVKPLGDLGGVKKTVKLTLAPGDGYTVGTTDKVKVKILPEAQ